MIHTYRITDHDIASAAEDMLIHDNLPTGSTKLPYLYAEACRLALAHVTWNWRRADHVIRNCERLKAWHRANSHEMPASLRDFRRVMAEQQARSDQKRTTWPGCEQGYMDCTDQTCACVESVPCEQFVVARTIRLLRGETT